MKYTCLGSIFKREISQHYWGAPLILETESGNLCHGKRNTIRKLTSFCLQMYVVKRSFNFEKKCRNKLTLVLRASLIMISWYNTKFSWPILRNYMLARWEKYDSDPRETKTCYSKTILCVLVENADIFLNSMLRVFSSKKKWRKYTKNELITLK